MSAPGQPSLVLLGVEGEASAALVRGRLADLVARGWDARLFREVQDRSLLADLEALPEEDSRRVQPPLRAAKADAWHLVLRAAGSAARHPRLARRELLGHESRLTRYLKSTLLALDPAVVHVASPRLWLRYARILRAIRARVVLGVVGEDAALPFQDPGLLAAALAEATAVHVESDGVAELIGPQAGGADVVRIPPGLDEGLLDLPPRGRTPGEPLRILGTGPLVWAEGYEHALQAVAVLARRGVPCRYRIVGQGNFAEAIAFARYQLGLDRLVEVLPPEGRDSMREHLAWADVSLCAAVTSRSPQGLLDTRAAGRPAVTTERAEGVVVVPRRDPEALADGLERLATDGALYAELREAGLRAARAASPEKRLELFDELYRRLAAPRAAGGAPTGPA